MSFQGYSAAQDAAYQANKATYQEAIESARSVLREGDWRSWYEMDYVDGYVDARYGRTQERRTRSRYYDSGFESGTERTAQGS